MYIWDGIRERETWVWIRSNVLTGNVVYDYFPTLGFVDN
jgi:hypothetical protein